jgi:hypothetical protein
MLEDIFSQFPLTNEKKDKATDSYIPTCDAETFSLSQFNIDSLIHSFSLRYINSDDDVYEFTLNKNQIIMFDHMELISKVYVVDLDKGTVNRRFSLIKMTDELTVCILDCGYIEEAVHTVYHRLSSKENTESRFFVSDSFIIANGLESVDVDNKRPSGCCDYKIVAVTMDRNKIAVIVKDKKGETSESLLNDKEFYNQCISCFDTPVDEKRSIGKMIGSKSTTVDDCNSSLWGWIVFLLVFIFLLVIFLKC